LSSGIAYLEGDAFKRDGKATMTMSDQQIKDRSKELNRYGRVLNYRDNLERAIKERKQVTLYKYRSHNSNTERDRRVEPVQFVNGGDFILCYDIEDCKMKTFKLSRIQGVKVHKEKWQYEAKHERKNLDVCNYGNSGTSYHIIMDMTMTGSDTFCELFSKSRETVFTRLDNGKWRLDQIVNSLEPLVSFFMSNAGSVEIVDSEGSQLLKSRINDSLRYIANVLDLGSELERHIAS